MVYVLQVVKSMIGYVFALIYSDKRQINDFVGTQATKLSQN